MVEVIVIAEGVTEEQFVKRIIAPALRSAGIYAKAQNLGGGVNFDRIKTHARNTLKGNNKLIVSTFIDLYALDTSFPGYSEAKQKSDLYAKVAFLESALSNAIIEHVGCRHDRFIPYIQPHEFEGLLFSDVKALASVEPKWATKTGALDKARADFETPEHINDSFETAPSKRLEMALSPKYRKTRHGPLAAEKITLSVIERECRHFRAWMERLRELGKKLSTGNLIDSTVIHS
jgi:hypothetical protein